MKFKDRETWERGLANNQDAYGSAVYRFAKRWADTMEQRMVDGAGVADVAGQASRDADTEGITGFMYGYAVSILSGCWEHGEDLRRWHNLDVQIGDEGERANKKGTVLNPALLNLSEEDKTNG